jgi:ABC-type multidrug transport system ATPase subunit
MQRDFGFYLAKVDFDEKSDEYVAASYFEECEGKKVTMDFNSSGSGYMQILQILAPIYSVCPGHCKVVMLDEPDAHLHPNMQIALAKSLMRIQKELGIQIIISTHSPSIIQTVSPNSIIPITEDSVVSTSLATINEVHDLITQIDNYELAKSVISGKMVFFEDKNTSILQAMDEILNSKVFYGSNTVSIHKAKGKDDKLPFQLHSLLKDYLKKEIAVHFVRDRDGLDDEWSERLKKHAQEHNVALHILDRHEIENYLLDASIIKTALKNKNPNRADIPSETDIQSKLIEFLKNTLSLSKYSYDDMLEDNIYKTALLLGDDRYKGYNVAKTEAKKTRAIYEKYTDFEDLVRVGMGKETRSQLLDWLNREKKLKIEKQDLIDALQLQDIPDEMNSLLRSLKSFQEDAENISRLEDATIDDPIIDEEDEENQITLWESFL